MRQIHLDSNGLVTSATDPPGQGNACHQYQVSNGEGEVLVHVSFQNGPVGEGGVNGVQHAQLLAILEDRLRSFQLGAYASPLNERALGGVQDAISADEERTARRSLAGAEGFNRPAKGVEG